jgi:hypothetical protein
LLASPPFLFSVAFAFSEWISSPGKIIFSFLKVFFKKFQSHTFGSKLKWGEVNIASGFKYKAMVLSKYAFFNIQWGAIYIEY